MSDPTPGKTSAFIFRLSSPDPFNCILYTDAGAFYSISTTTTGSADSAYRTAPPSGLAGDLPTPPASPTSVRHGSSSRNRVQAPEDEEVITFRSARGQGERLGEIRRAQKGWEVVFGPFPEDEVEGERGRAPKRAGVAFSKFFGLSIWGKVVGQKPKMRDPSGGVWTWMNYRTGRDVYLLDSQGTLCAQYRPPDPARTMDPNAALIVYEPVFEVKELVVLGWLALERVGREEGVEGKSPKGTNPGRSGVRGKKRGAGSGEWRKVSLGGSTTEET